MSTFDDKSTVDKVKSAVNDIVDQSGEKIAGVVDKVTDGLDRTTGGATSAVTAKVDGAVFGAMGKAVDAGRAATKKAADAVALAKDAVKP